MKIIKTPYPKYTEEESLNFKFYAKDREDIRGLYRSGISVNKIAKQYRTGWGVIKCIVDPNYRKKQMEWIRAWHLINKPNKKKKVEHAKKYFKRKTTVRPEIRERNLVISNKWNKDNVDRRRKKARALYWKNRTARLQYAKERYLRLKNENN